MSRQQRRMPSEKSIRRYWADTDLWQKKGYDSQEEFVYSNSCFACGRFSNFSLEKAHITPRVNNGTDAVDNIHMLCIKCHTDSEYLEGDQYWQWLYSRNIIAMMTSRAILSGAISIDEASIILLTQRNNNAL